MNGRGFMDSFPGYYASHGEQRRHQHRLHQSSMEDLANSWHRIDHKTFLRRFTWGLEAVGLCAFLIWAASCI